MRLRSEATVLAVIFVTLTLVAPVLATTSPNIITSCNKQTDNIPAYTDQEDIHNPGGSPINGYAYLDSSTGPVGFNSYFSNNGILYVIISNGNPYAVSATYTYCFQYN